MRKTIYRPTRLLTTGLLILLLLSMVPGFAGGLSADDIQADAFVLMDAATGQILLEKNLHEVRKPASITKIMTALLALEKGDLEDMVTVSQTAANIPRDASSVGLTAGETLSLEDALYATMLESANEAANAVAEYVSGSMPEFAALMTERARELGALNTHFANANGLDDDAHFTSAYDMALITQAALAHEKFRAIIGSYQHIMGPTNVQQVTRIFNNKNRMLPQGSMPYSGIIGGKTGFTRASQSTLVETAQRNGRELICILLLGPSSLSNFQDAALLLNFGFNEFRPVTHRDEAYDNSCSFLLHQDLEMEQLEIIYDDPITLEDGGQSVNVSFALGEETPSRMYADLGTFTLNAAPPPLEPEEPSLLSLAGLQTLFTVVPPFSWIAAFFAYLALLITRLIGLINLLPTWLAWIVKAGLGLFALLFVLACIFRTLRWRRRRKRRALKKRNEERRKTYREQQSFWG